MARPIHRSRCFPSAGGSGLEASEASKQNGKLCCLSNRTSHGWIRLRMGPAGAWVAAPAAAGAEAAALLLRMHTSAGGSPGAILRPPRRALPSLKSESHLGAGGAGLPLRL